MPTNGNINSWLRIHKDNALKCFKVSEKHVKWPFMTIKLFLKLDWRLMHAEAKTESV